MSDYFRQNATKISFNNDDSWVVLEPIEQQIKEKIERIGTPLKNWDINIYRGILTGYNEAFIISQETRDKLIAASPKNDEIIRPILRGRDVKKYSINFANQWIINSHNGLKKQNIDRIDIMKDYPTVYSHFEQYKSILEKRLDQGDHWTNLRNCAYLDNFDKEKIIWLELTDKPNFALDSKGYFINNTIFFMTGNHLKYLLAFLNSRFCEWYFDKIAATSGVGTRRWIKIYIDQICIPLPKKEVENKLISLVDKVKDNPSESILKEIDNAIYNLMALNSEEISYIESANL